MSDRILVVQGASYGRAIDGLGELTSRVSEFMKNPKDFKLVMFTGGADVDPKFYGDSSPNNYCYSNPERDIYEIAIYKMARKADIPMTGICRGIQFLNVMNGGKMIHHMDGHESSVHNMELIDGRVFKVNSLHHQMILPPTDSHVIGWAAPPIASMYYGQKDIKLDYKGLEVEAVIFPKTKSFGVQYHPEMLHKDSDGFKYYYIMVQCALITDWNNFMNLYTTRLENDESTTLHKPDYSLAR